MDSTSHDHCIDRDLWWVVLTIIVCLTLCGAIFFFYKYHLTPSADDVEKQQMQVNFSRRIEQANFMDNDSKAPPPIVASTMPPIVASGLVSGQAHQPLDNPQVFSQGRSNTPVVRI